MRKARSFRMRPSAPAGAAGRSNVTRTPSRRSSSATSGPPGAVAMTWGWASGGFWRQPPRATVVTSRVGRAAAILILSMGPSIEQRPCPVKLAQRAATESLARPSTDRGPVMSIRARCRPGRAPTSAALSDRLGSMKLYGYWRSSSTWRVRIALAWKGIPHEYQPVHMLRGGGEQHAAAYLAVNPLGEVPDPGVDRSWRRPPAVAVVRHHRLPGARPPAAARCSRPIRSWPPAPASWPRW